MTDRKPGHLTKIEEILKNSLGSLNLDNSIKVAPIWRNWSKIVGDSIADKSTPELVNGQTLIVGVINNVWLQELTIQKKMFLAKINASFPEIKITDIRFKIRSE